MHIDAIILDMDGTLIDTESLYKQSWQQSAKQLGFEISDNTYTKLIGIPFSQCLKVAKTLLPTNISIETFHNQLTTTQARLKKIQGFPMKPGATKLLDLLQTHPISIALVTSSGRENVNEHFMHTPYSTLFDIVVTFEDTTLHKPNPEPYLLACKQLSIRPEKVLAIEDSNTGVRSALNAGCHTLMIPDILPPEDDIKNNNNLVGIYPDLSQATDKIIRPLLNGLAS